MIRRSIALIAVWLVALTVFVVLSSRRPLPTPPPDKLWPVPSFEVTGVTTNGPSPLRQKDLLGTPWMADFIYTRCGGPCPLMSGKMEALQRVLPPEVRLVSFSVDPDYDTVPVLQAYAKRFHADPARWVFARAEKHRLLNLIREGFHLTAAEQSGGPAETRVLHSTQFILVDAQGFVRGVYDSTQESFISRLRQDLQQLSPH